MGSNNQGSEKKTSIDPMNKDDKEININIPDDEFIKSLCGMADAVCASVRLSDTNFNNTTPASPSREVTSKPVLEIPLCPPSTPPRDPRTQYRLRPLLMQHRVFCLLRLPCERRFADSMIIREVEESVTTPDQCVYRVKYQEM